MQRAKPKITIIAIFHLMGTFSTFSNYIFSRENSETRAYGTAMKNQLKNCEKLERQLLAIFSELSGNRRSAFPARLSKVLPAFWRRRRQRQRWISCSEKPGKPRGKRVPPEATGVAGRKTASTWHPQTATAGRLVEVAESVQNREPEKRFSLNTERERESVKCFLLSFAEVWLFRLLLLLLQWIPFDLFLWMKRFSIDFQRAKSIFWQNLFAGQIYGASASPYGS